MDMGLENFPDATLETATGEEDEANGCLLVTCIGVVRSKMHRCSEVLL